MCERQHLCLPPRCWCCSSCPSFLCWPSRSLTSCQSPSPTHKRHRRASLRCTSVGHGQDTHLLYTSKTSETKTKHVVYEAAELRGPPFCLRQLSVLGPDFGASDLVLLQQWLLLQVPLLLCSPAFQSFSGSFSLSGITTTSCSGALQ